MVGLRLSTFLEFALASPAVEDKPLDGIIMFHVCRAVL